jgi:hypothetical protein
MFPQFMLLSLLLAFLVQLSYVIFRQFDSLFDVRVLLTHTMILLWLRGSLNNSCFLPGLRRIEAI